MHLGLASGNVLPIKELDKGPMAKTFEIHSPIIDSPKVIYI